MMQFYYCMFFFSCLLISVEGKNKIIFPSWEDCGGPDATLRINSIDLDHPIKIGKHDPIRIGMNATQLQQISGDSIVSIKIFKIIKILGQRLPSLPVPCINGLGSCQMTLCDVFKIHKKLVCAIFKAAGQPCDCPSAPGEFIAKNIEYLLNFGNIPTPILLIGNGEYSMDMKITHEDKTLGCMKLNVAVKFV